MCPWAQIRTQKTIQQGVSRSYLRVVDKQGFIFAFLYFVFNFSYCFFDKAFFENIFFFQDFPGCPGVKNLPCRAGDRCSIPGLGTKIPRVMEQLSPCAITTESALQSTCSATEVTIMRSRCSTAKRSPCSLQPEKAWAQKRRASEPQINKYQIHIYVYIFPTSVSFK